MDYDFLFKILLVGQSHVGKTALLNRYIDDAFHEQSFTTIGVDFKLKSLDVTVREVCKSVKLQLWDTAGQERFHAITNSYFRGCHGIMLVFALDDLETFQKIQYWINMVDRQNVEFKLLIGNKSDLQPHIVSRDMIDNFLADHPGLRYMETSAKTGNHVDECFKEMATVLSERMTEERQMLSDGKETVLPKIVTAQQQQPSGGGTKCCGGTG